MSEKIYTIAEIKAILQKLLENMPVYSVILFGSYAKNSANKNSDLDFIIDTKETLMGFKLYSLITKIEEAFNKDVDAFEKSEIIENSRIDEEIKKTGVVVYEK
ncbi:MAG: nucleotidyltransferase domain-containing protein [Clostridia bacterium]|nr:nucleotidyltransferase domain-containing protein [Clostridia bacterium]